MNYSKGVRLVYQSPLSAVNYSVEIECREQEDLEV
jgi:hypothetical protein